MIENLITQSYCEVCGIDVEPQTNLRRFGKLFCSDDHLNQYVKSRQRRMGYVTDDNYDQVKREEEKEEERPRGWRSWFRGGCC